MSAKATLLMVIHNHQPVGNFDHVFEHCTDHCYHPTLEVLAEFPSVRLTMHTTGPLLEWLAANRPETITLMKQLVARDQIEILGGCHNEAMACVLPDRDVLGQVATMRAWCDQKLGARPRGMWLAERVWEPDLPRVLHDSGVEYTLLDDIGFRFAGVDDETIWGHFTTEKGGKPLTLFPIDQQLRYLIPFEEPDDVLAHLKKTSEDAGGHVWLTYGDDGEKFGIWPRTADLVFGEGDWLRRFFQALTDNRDWLTTSTLGDAADSLPSRGRVYLPTCSYDEMMEWAQPTAQVTAFHNFRQALKKEERLTKVAPHVRGGIWQCFLSKYPEADRMHKRTIGVSERIDRLRAAAVTRPWLEEDDHPLYLAQRELYRAQCNDALWHGLFGGLYLTNLRHKVWEHLLAAEVLLDEVDPPTGDPEWIDVDLDGRAECVIADETLHMVVEPHRGGAVSELSFKPRRFNLMDTLARREEHYHDAILNPPEPEPVDPDSDEEAVKSIHDLHEVKEDGLEDLLVYDNAPLTSFRDRFFAPGLGVAQWCGDALTHEADIGDFADGEYAIGVSEDGLELTRTGTVDGRAVQVTKQLAITGEGEVTGRWTLALADDGPALEIAFAPELSFNLLAPESKDRYYAADDLRLDDWCMISAGAVTAKTLSLIDAWSEVRIDLTPDWPAQFWRAPVQTVSASESGIERIYQASVVLPRWSGTLAPGAGVNLSLTLGVK